MPTSPIRSPLSSLSSLSENELHRLPYSPTSMLGARDVSSPFGCMRVYEWGSATGRKILFIHGLSTPAPALAGVAERMVAAGARVMIIDLWGRGYSDTPPDLPHDVRLYTSQILLALSTSPLDCTSSASGGFVLVGYSMGGAIAAVFASEFPQLLSNVVLLAPGGLYRSLPGEYKSLVMRFPWLFPVRYVKSFIKRLLNGSEDTPYSPLPAKAGTKSPGRANVSESSREPVVEGGRALLDVQGIVDFEIKHHPGFVHTVISAIKHAPVLRQDEQWRRLGKWLSGQRGWETCSGRPNRLRGTKMLIMLGIQDTVLDTEEFVPLASAALGGENVVFRYIEGEHDFPIRRYEEVSEALCEFLELGSP